MKVQNAWVDGITSQPMKSGVSLFQTLTSSANVQTNEVITNCQNNICTADVHNPDREDTKGLSVFPVKMLCRH